MKTVDNKTLTTEKMYSSKQCAVELHVFDKNVHVYDTYSQE